MTLQSESGIAHCVSIQPFFTSFKSDYHFVHFSALYLPSYAAGKSHTTESLCGQNGMFITFLYRA
jgi:hypothetical protein